ncbi:MAG: hypothetical protein BWY69_01166 [Planctomycetes bacterium ADurb.Bin401]|nr:MAG: hypothetical protein BWY69_01166 [Planctomycetes bacterium ADurb.Bin401]
MIEHVKNLIAAKNGEGWEQLIIIAVVFGFAILKKLFSALKEYSEKQQTQQQPRREETARPAAARKRYYADSEFKTIEQLREEKIAQIRAAYGIPEPVKHIPKRVQEEIEREKARQQELRSEEIRQEELRRQDIRSEEIRREQEMRIEPPPIHIPAKKKKKAFQPQTVQPTEYLRHETAPPHKAKRTVESKEYEQIISFESPRDLRSAILYQEILGKPLALRE